MFTDKVDGVVQAKNHARDFKTSIVMSSDLISSIIYFIIGTKMDTKACESLESIFKRIQFEVLDIENCSLEEEVRNFT